MPGVPGAGGPMPKRSSEVRRTNRRPTEGVEAPAELVEVPALPGGLHQLAVDWYESLRHSAQSVFYEPSDWEQARMVASAMSAFHNGGCSNAALYVAIQQAQRPLLTTEGERRRARVEVERMKPNGAEQPPNVSDIRARMSQGGRRGR